MAYERFFGGEGGRIGALGAMGRGSKPWDDSEDSLWNN